MTGGGILRGGLAAAAALIASCVVAASAQGAVLFNQVPDGSFSVGTFPSFASNAAQSNQAADDFTVPPGQIWVPSSADTFGAIQAGSGGATGNAWIYADAGALPGGQLFAQSGGALTGGDCSTSANCDPTFALANAPRLEPGRYWISLQIQGAYAWRWAVTPPELASGSPAVWQNPGDGFGTGCTTYTPLIDCDSFIDPATSGRDMMFRLNGDLIDSRFTVQGFESTGNRIFLRAVFPDPGKAKIKGKKIKKTSKAVNAGSTKLRIKLTKGAKRKLQQGKKVKASANVTFTATGGVPFSLKAKVTIVPVRGAADGRPILRVAG
jgi:hypothetical protein